MGEISTYLPGVLLSYGAFLLALASPGPNVLAVIGTSMSVDRQSGLALASGVVIGTLTWASLTTLGLASLLATFASAVVIIKVIGGSYLLWLAFKAFRSAASAYDLNAAEMAGAPRSLLGYVGRGYFVQMTNPKAAMAWIAIVSLGLPHGAPGWVPVAIILGTFFLSAVFHFLYAWLFSTPIAFRIYGQARRPIQALLGSFFGYAGVRLLCERG